MERGHFQFCPICGSRLLRLREHLTNSCLANRLDEIDDAIDWVQKKELQLIQNQIILKSQIISWGGNTNVIIDDLIEKGFTIKNDIENE
uniref:Uncharacterized protein n=1 Tax=Romanomermis culicivorax TaxID=13658 RepID=A0A915IKG2_ROMCU